MKTATNDYSLIEQFLAIVGMSQCEYSALQALKRFTSLRQWMAYRYTQNELKEMTQQGIDGGFNGLIYYRETGVLYTKFQAEIWEGGRGRNHKPRLHA